MQERWILDLVGAVLTYEDEHPPEATCFDEVVEQIPAEVKIVARAIREHAEHNRLQAARLAAVREWADAVVAAEVAPQYGRDVLWILGLSLTELQETNR
ncbi:hypothetical protein G3H63_09280 [Microbacterium resistens]|uniref:hypothetical protein n=1 Tax=Microbacterium resistens TaxID=156977 RepID=UPI001C56EEF7|nr:hypothetical protein [Microbacterium resistens]MBW1639261.1 hypothetical protein [Microbacterium resistens]